MSNVNYYCICRSSDTDRFMIGCDSCNEWYHGDCISITEELARTIVTFYCLPCRDRNPSLTIEYKQPGKGKSNNKPSSMKKKKPTSTKPSKVTRFEGHREDEVDNDDGFLKMKAEEDLNEVEDDDDDAHDATFNIENELSERRNKSSKSKSKSKSNSTSRRSTAIIRSTSNRRENKKAHRTREKDDYAIDDLNSVKQCYGPNCINMARRGSKYCSDQCGIALARDRIDEILGSNLMAIAQGSTADLLGQNQLEAIDKEREKCAQFLMELDAQQRELEKMIAEGKKLTPIPEDEVEDDQGVDADLMIYCVTCGHEIASRTAMRHMERCFNKFESQTSFTALSKAKVDGVFCDVYNPQQKTYCMRLKVLCPEHTKEQRISDTEVCGFPMVADLFTPTGEHCRLPKKKCMRHYSWEKLRRAHLDMERVQKWLKLEELHEKEQKLRRSLSKRKGVLNLMLNTTISH